LRAGAFEIGGLPFAAFVGRTSRGLLRVGANSPSACPTLSGVTFSETARRPVSTRTRRPTLEVARRTARGLITLSMLPTTPGRFDSRRRRRTGGINGGFQLERDILAIWQHEPGSENDSDDVVLGLAAPLLVNHEKLRKDGHQRYYHHGGGRRDSSPHHEPLVDALANVNVLPYRAVGKT